jgi:diacylglycerol kinase (ATP)
MKNSICKVCVVINPAAGRPEPILTRIARTWGETAIRWDVTVTHKAGDAERAARAAVRCRVDAVAVYGGDGTIMEVANGLLGSKVPLAILPGGTANAFAATLKLPGRLEDACALLARETPAIRTVDAGQLGERHFLLRAGAGLEARVINRTRRAAKRRLGILAYSLTALRMLRAAPRARYHLRLDGQTHVVEGVSCMVANSGNLGINGLAVSPDCRIGDGLLDVFILQRTNFATLVSLAAAILRGRNHLALAHWQAQTAAIEVDPPQPVVCDGERAGTTPIEARIIPAALRVVVPGEQQGSEA